MLPTNDPPALAQLEETISEISDAIASVDDETLPLVENSIVALEKDVPLVAAVLASQLRAERTYRERRRKQQRAMVSV